MSALAGWRPALRIARRTVRRNLGRSILIAALVGIPVAGATLVDVLYRSTDDPERAAYSQIGTADAVIDVTALGSLPADYFPHPERAWDWHPDDIVRDSTAVDLAALLPPGSTVVPVGSTRYGWLTLTAGEQIVRSDLVITQPADPMTTHQARLDQGRWPTASREVLITATLADRLGLLANGRLVADAAITARDYGEYTVVGLALQPFCLSCEAVVVPPESPLTASDDEWITSVWPGGISYLADLPDGIDVDVLWPELAQVGVAMVPREAYVNPERYDPHSGVTTTSSVYEAQRTAMVATVVALGLLEIVLLAGAAFAVGARRQTRDLGLMAVAGATPRQIRNTVLAQGFVLGVLGAVSGLAVGALVTVAGRPVWQRTINELIEDWRFGTTELAGAAVVGILAGVAAAVVPAIGAARMAVVDALAGRFRTSTAEARLPIAGVALTVLGALVAFIGNRLIADEFATYAERLRAAEGTGQFVTQPAIAVPVLFQLAGLVIAIGGLIIVMPALISLVARLGRLLPLAPRYAVRDAARHRHRTAPAIAAIMIVVTGTVGAAFAVAGLQRANDLRWVPTLPQQVMEVSSADPADTITAATAVAAELPNGTVVPHDRLAADSAGEDLIAVEASPAGTADCEPNCGFVARQGNVALDSPALLELSAAGAAGSDARDALAAGEVVVLDPGYVDDDGMVTLIASGSGRSVLRLPARLAERPLPYQSLPTAIVPSALAEQQGWTTVSSSTLITYGEATADQIDAALDAAENRGAYAYVERQPDGERAIFVALIVGSAFVTLVGVAISVALAAAESRADVATLAAVGAPPRRRRLIAGSQALVVGGLGTGLGIALATYIAFTAWPTTGSPDFIVPWGNMLITGIAVPALAVVIAVAFTPSRLPLVRRLG